VSIRSLIFKYRKSEDGVTAIEFSLLAIPYFMLVLGILEISIMFASASLLDGAVTNASRMIRTGQLQNSVGDPETNFRNALCDYATVLVDCNSVQLEVVPIDSFANYNNYDPTYDADGDLVSQGFDAGGSEDEVLVRVVYYHSLVTPLVAQLLGGPDQRQLFVTTMVFQSEPYEFNGGA
tara:strand:- start:4452 stop:4988 length:537 start_codon:yes stop_codon:yes gene_type:complete